MPGRLVVACKLTSVSMGLPQSVEGKWCITNAPVNGAKQLSWEKSLFIYDQSS